MASSKAEKLPNLRIRIDNEESDTDNDELCLTDEPNISVEDGEIDKRISVAKTDEFPNRDPPVWVSERASTSDDEVQFNVYLNKLDPIPVDNAFIMPTRRYENREGNFVTGIDISKKEEIEKLQERAKRFGMKFKPEPSVSLEELYKSLGLKPEDLSRKDERGIRLEAIHFRGVHEMNTKDIFNYFQEFAAGGCEWIDDGSCNVVWQDKLTAARAMLKLSCSYEQVMEKFGLKSCSKNTQDTDKRQVKCENFKPENVTEATDVNVEEREEERMEEDDDELDLTEGNKIKESKVIKSVSETTRKLSESGEEDMEEGEISDDSEEEHIIRDPEGFSKIPWPPGKWRLGVPYKDRARYLFLRFATKADVKLPGAESRSKFYQKYGNPNYGGVRGLLSKSLKKKLHAHKDEDMIETSDIAGGGDARYINRDQISYGDDMFSDTIAPLEVEEIDMYVKPTKAVRKSKKIPNSENDDSEHSTDENDYPVVEHAVVPNTLTKPECGSDSDVDEAELERLLGGGDRKPVMRMYADEIEEKQKSQRHRQLIGALTIVTDAKKKVKRVQDARQLITGVDLHSSLKDKMVNRQRSPLTLKRSISQSMSPEIVPPRKEPMKLSPIHMTIENSPPSDESSSSSAEEEEEKVKETVQEKQPKSPIEFKSKMDEAEPHKDVRSRLSQRAPDTKADVRLSRRSPNNVKSRLSKRISPITVSPRRSQETISPKHSREREHQDTRISRVRKSRSPPNFRPYFRSYLPVGRHAPLRRSRSPDRRRFNDRYRSSYSRHLNRSRSRSPVNRRNAHLNVRSRSPVNRHVNNRSSFGQDTRSRLGRKSRSPTDTDSDSENEKDVAPLRTKTTVEAKSSSSSSSSSSDSSSDDSSSDSSSSSSSSSSASSSSDSESDSDASERNAIRNKKSQRQAAELAQKPSSQMYEKQVRSQKRPQPRSDERIDSRRSKHKL